MSSLGAWAWLVVGGRRRAAREARRPAAGGRPEGPRSIWVSAVALGGSAAGSASAGSGGRYASAAVGSRSMAIESRGLLFERLFELIPHLLVLEQVNGLLSESLLVAFQVAHCRFEHGQLAFFQKRCGLARQAPAPGEPNQEHHRVEGLVAPGGVDGSEYAERAAQPVDVDASGWCRHEHGVGYARGGPQELAAVGRRVDDDRGPAARERSRSDGRIIRS